MSEICICFSRYDGMVVFRILFPIPYNISSFHLRYLKIEYTVLTKIRWCLLTFTELVKTRLCFLSFDINSLLQYRCAPLGLTDANILWSNFWVERVIKYDALKFNNLRDRSKINSRSMLYGYWCYFYHNTLTKDAEILIEMSGLVITELFLNVNDIFTLLWRLGGPVCASICAVHETFASGAKHRYIAWVCDRFSLNRNYYRQFLDAIISYIGYSKQKNCHCKN